MRSPTLIVCRSAREPLTPGNVRNHFCKVCHEEVQISPVGQSQLAVEPETFVLCNPCGLKLAEAHARKGTLAGVGMTPNAMQLLEEIDKRGRN